MTTNTLQVEFAKRRAWLRVLGTLSFVALSVAVALRLLPDTLALDDAYTHLRTARNVAQGHGPVFSPGDTWLGSTSTLYVLVLGALHRVSGIDLLVLAAGLHVAAAALLGLVLHRLCANRAAAHLAWLIPPILFSRPSVSLCTGMETPWLLVALVWASHAALAQRQTQLGLAWVALALLRPDGAVCVAATFALAWWRSGRPPLRAVAVAAALMSPWVIYALSHFGTLIPLSAHAKLLHRQSGLWLSLASRMPEFVARDFSMPWLVLAGLGALTALRWRWTALWLLPISAAHTLSLVATSAPGFLWYLQTMYLAIAVGMVAALRAALLCLRIPDWLAMSATLAALASFSSPWLAASRRATPWPTNLLPEHDRYLPLARIARAGATTDDRLATLEVGILGYFTDLPLVDFCGLVTPGIAEHLPSHDHVRYAMAEFAPSLVIAHHPQGELEAGLHELLRLDYSLVQRLGDTSLWRRWPSAADLAQRIAVVTPADVDAIEFEQWPRSADHRAVLANLAAAGRARLRVEMPGEPRQAPSHPRAYVDAAGQIVVLGPEALAAVTFDARALRHWIAPEQVLGVSEPSGLVRTTVSAPPVVVGRVGLAGPLVRVRVKAELRSLSNAPPTGHARLSWTSSTSVVHRFDDRVEVTAATDGTVQELVFELPPGRFPPGQSMIDLFVQPFDFPCSYVLHEVRVERTP